MLTNVERMELRALVEAIELMIDPILDEGIEQKMRDVLVAIDECITLIHMETSADKYKTIEDLQALKDKVTTRLEEI